MQQRAEEKDLILALEPGEEVGETLRALARDLQLPGGFLSGIGAVNQARIGYYRPEKLAYDERSFSENLEVVSLVGNLGWAGKEPVLHAHVSLGRADFSLVGGHLFEATVSVTLELTLRPTLHRVDRERDERFDLNLLRLSVP